MSYYWEHREERLKYAREYRKRNPNNPAYMKKWDSENREKRKEYRNKALKKRMLRNKEFINNYKKGKSCSKCGYNEFTDILHFHHLRDKSFGIGEGKSKSIESIKLEIEKCILLCPNCHAIEHLAKV